ncbi:MAG: hypothetical protein LBJ95_04725 [Oscillospiraceae bacterium]|jgi:hypothetical protein|nr:hypothetical protein [Oscillospiraceae bacterium]
MKFLKQLLLITMLLGSCTLHATAFPSPWTNDSEESVVKTQASGLKHSYILPNKYDPTKITLVAIPVQPGYEFSFVVQKFYTRSEGHSRPQLPKVVRLPWSLRNTVEISKPMWPDDLDDGEVTIQYAVDCRLANIGGTTTKFILGQEIIHIEANEVRYHKQLN